MKSEKHHYQYAVIEHDEHLDNATKFGSSWSAAYLDYVAEDAAECEFHEHDGWEAHWPLTFQLWDMDGKELGVFKVEQEAIPSFTARKVEEEPDAD